MTITKKLSLIFFIPIFFSFSQLISTERMAAIHVGVTIKYAKDLRKVFISKERKPERFNF